MKKIKSESKANNVEDAVNSAQVETEDDLEAIDPSLLGKAVVFGTDWTAGTLIDQLRRGNISLDPIFQRRDAWTAPRKSKFIESIVLGLPIPQIVLAESPTGKGSFLVIDGKQRLLSLQQFAGIGLKEGAEPLKIEGLSIRTELNGLSYEDLQSDARLAKQFNAFENQPIRTVVVKNWQKEDVLYVIFHRLNSETLPLSAQELRQALHPGPFLRFAADYTEKLGGIHRALGISKPDFRMRDVELLVRYYAFQDRLVEYKGNLKQFLDDACSLLNKQWKDKENEVKDQANELESAIDTTFKIFGDDAFQKWDVEQKQFEGRFNRAVFDVMVYYFSRNSIRTAAVKASAKVERGFRRLCETDPDFLRSIETTTKSKTATSKRFGAWKAQLEKALGKGITISKNQQHSATN